MKQVESSEFESVQNSFKQKVQNQYPSGSLTNNRDIGISRMHIHPSNRCHLNGHIFTELKDDFLFLQRVGNDIPIAPIIIILINQLHKTSNKMCIRTVETDKVTSKSSFLSSVEQFRHLNVFKDGWGFFVFVLP